ncbi:EamA family transporter [Lysinibacillus telephonicus]|uniref:EamA domain-containing protein n=1 Tax=Lysinibacillus telephonicus TaxID=1714840 RepID=A0A3S0KJG1_9BACI|nr:EamA family transporter [Lysinibacillus telephonicus]RTQ93158.1 hypothetical protein EKG35_09505 [Lysinibacillus telephonicus]
MNWLILVLNILCMVVGQIAWKTAVKGVIEWNLTTIINVIFSIPFITGGFLYVTATGLWLVLLSRIPLSIAYPMQSISYILGIIAGVVIFKETFTYHQLVGGVLIIIGVIILTWKV